MWFAYHLSQESTKMHHLSIHNPFVMNGENESILLSGL